MIHNRDLEISELKKRLRESEKARGDTDRENRGLKKDYRGLKKENRTVCHDSRKKDKMIQKYKEEIALNDALWSTDKDKERLGKDPYRFHAREMLETILSTPNLLRI